jgi:pantothenate kinase
VTLERIGGILLGVGALVGVVALLTTRDRSARDATE